MRALRDLEAIRTAYAAGMGDAKAALIERLAKTRFARATEVLRFHEVLCFLRAHPDDARVHETVTRALDAFGLRRDVARFRSALADTGIEGTPIFYRFFWPTARWLAERWPKSFAVDWTSFEGEERLEKLLPLFVPYGQAPEVRAASRAKVLLLSPDRADGSALVFGIDGLGADDAIREHIHDDLDPPYRLDPGPGTPSRTLALHHVSTIAFRTEAFSTARPDLLREVRRSPDAMRDVGLAEGKRLVDLARGAMVTRSRDLDAFSYGSPRDVTMVEDDAGLSFAFIGIVPERRLFMRAAYGTIFLENGVPIGYGQADVILRTAEISFNVFETFRGAEASRVLARYLAAVRAFLGAQAFSIEPYQLGRENEEGIASGAFWFYYKLGFRPNDEDGQRIVARELARMKRNPRHRSGRRTLGQLALKHVYFSIDRRPPIDPTILVRRAAERSKDRPGIREAMLRIFGKRAFARMTSAERLWVDRWAGLLVSLEGIESFSAAEKRSTIEVVKAKGGQRERDFVERLDDHARLSKSLKTFAGAARHRRSS